MSAERNRRGGACACARDTVRLSAAAACSLEPAGNVSWPGGTSGREGAGCYWEETNQCRATAAPSPSPHCTCTHTQTHTHTHTHTHTNYVRRNFLWPPCCWNLVCACVSGVLNVIIGELFEDLTEDLVFERLGLQRSFKDQICELVDWTDPFGRVVAHVLHHRCSWSQGQQGRASDAGAENLSDLILAATVQEIRLFGSNLLQ